MTLLCVLLVLFAACDLAECDWASMTRQEKWIELALTGLTVFACGWAIALDVCA